VSYSDPYGRVTPSNARSLVIRQCLVASIRGGDDRFPKILLEALATPLLLRLVVPHDSTAGASASLMA
jgi:hypothetical protein